MRRLGAVLLVFKAGKILRVSCGVSALFCRFSMNDHTPMMSLYSHVICLANETSFRIVGEVQWVERYIDSSCQLFIRISEKVETSLIILGHQFSRFLTFWHSQAHIPSSFLHLVSPNFVRENFKVHRFPHCFCANCKLWRHCETLIADVPLFSLPGFLLIVCFRSSKRAI